MTERKRYAVVGVGSRGVHFIRALLGPHRHHAELAAFCDSDTAVIDAWRDELGPEAAAIPAWPASELEEMIAELAIDTVVVTSPDHTHHEIIRRAMDAGCDTITEKPLTTDATKCQEIVDAAQRTGRQCRVAFNYRYAPLYTATKQALVDGVIGQITGIVHRHTLGNEHGPYYFHRWHAESRLTGGLLIHKATHIFDYITWFIGSVPRSVYARAGRFFFTPEQAQAMGLEERGERCPDCPVQARCPFFRYPDSRGEPAPIEAVRREVSGYSRDLCVFRPEADIPDSMHVLVEYENGVSFSYQLTAFGAPSCDGKIFGTLGNIKFDGHSAPYLTPHYGEPRPLPVERIAGGHGGADPVLFTDLFDPAAPPDPLKRMADHHAGAWSALIGIAANASIVNGQAVLVRDLVTGLKDPDYPACRAWPAGVDARDVRSWVDVSVQARIERRKSRQRSLQDTFGPNG